MLVMPWFLYVPVVVWLRQLYLNGHNPKETDQPWAIELYVSQNARGWTDPLPAGSKRVLVKPLVIGGVVFFVTFIPDKNVYAGNGESWLMAVDFETGLIPDKPIWDINGAGWTSDADVYNAVDKNLGQGYRWNPGPTVTGGTFHFESQSVVLVRNPSTRNSVGS